MADRDEERPAAGLGPERGTDDLALVLERAGIARCRAGIGETPEEPGLGDADRRLLQEHAQVAGEAETAGVRPALPVGDDEIGWGGEQPQYGERGRHLAEREKARAIGEGDTMDDLRTFEKLEASGVDDRGSSEGGVTIGAEVDIHAGDMAGCEARWGGLDDLVTQSFLNRPRLG